jgi:hypothetical protein
MGRGLDADTRGATDGRQDHNLPPESSASRHIICIELSRLGQMGVHLRFQAA